MDWEEITRFLKSLDRSLFLGDEYKKDAGLDAPLPIGHGQTISQPTLVAKMTYELEPDKSSRVLEIGTGSGYQTAFLAEFSGEVYTVELIPELAAKARNVLEKLGYGNIKFKVGDGSEGWKEEAPFDRIMTTAASGTVPSELVGQLKNNGRMIAPVGPPYLQDLMLITKDEEGKITQRSLGKVVFVEFRGKYGFGK